ncbi:hypothetical protein NUKP37_01340 [Klebsiella variicola]|uniref:Uncharacterized protein n=1 Tax=Klebsiella variicola TaxID=244366 RepID=A0A9P3UDL8_KLEVA|nr:hypothetical protein NUKP37_01340 [Klebsiella variicola]
MPIGNDLAPMVRLSAAAKASNSNNPGTAIERTAVVENDITDIPDMIMIVIIVIDFIQLW